MPWPRDISTPSSTACRPPIPGSASFLAAIDRAFTTDPLADTPAAARAAFALLAGKISAGEVADVRHVLPKPIRDLWPE